MKPRGNPLVSALKRICQTQYRRGEVEGKNGVYHKKAEEVYRESIASQLMDLLRCARRQFQGTAIHRIAAVEIMLAKIISLRYIAFGV